jgi:arylformamidase
VSDGRAPFVEASVRLAPGTPEWPGDTPYACGWTWSMADGASVNVSAITLSPHVGTHADAPLHVRDGAPASDALPVEAFVGEALLLDVSDVPCGPAPDGPGALTLDALRARAADGGGSLDGVRRLLLRTGRTIADGRFPDAWPWVTSDAVRALAADGLLLLGVDAPSIDARDSRDLGTHHALFDAGGCNLENLDLRAAAPGRWELWAPPLLLVGLDGAPARALLRPLPDVAGS